MAKYTIDQKLEAISMYESGQGSTTICHKLGISQEATILRWKYLYETYGIDGLKRSNKLPSYTSSFKMEVITWLVKNGASFPVTARHFDIPNEGTVWQWKRRYDVHGFDGLADRRKRVSNMSKDNKKLRRNDDQKKLDSDDKIKQLERDNEYLKAENEYLKKLKAVMDRTDKKSK
ncbi:helix-turn-helix domain-containing protein [Companilactobacillus mishanensis]|uniref:Helix-turn-helix domain-containing protein n=3 Tax=Companilactobacillus mishanensis TaxID=2486008 RepID=A0ABW9P5R6_9LACO|nr:helix-turn-helix domain-containing protein [Companilactobacillus mishanensis]MQS44570.1 helix-turn-helix domain-containing protein [Companilactobacillus mishanensis]